MLIHTQGQYVVSLGCQYTWSVAQYNMVPNILRSFTYVSSCCKALTFSIDERFEIFQKWKIRALHPTDQLTGVTAPQYRGYPLVAF